MERPIEVDLPHKLGRDEARRRIDRNIGKLGSHIPGGASQVETEWVGDDLNLAITAMGQAVRAQIGVQETLVRVRVALPPMLAMFAKPFEAMMRSRVAGMLEDKSKKD